VTTANTPSITTMMMVVASATETSMASSLVWCGIHGVILLVNIMPKNIYMLETYGVSPCWSVLPLW
jgi:hypothetical protein